MEKLKNDRKQLFIRWFLRQYQPTRMEAKWLLDYIAAYPEVIARIVFVSDYRLYPESIFISAKGTNKAGFLYKSGDTTSEDIENYYYQMKPTDTHPLYVEVHFPGSFESHQFTSVLEEDPSLAFLTNYEKQEAKYIIMMAKASFKREHLIKQIDDSLDKRDEKKFLALLHNLKEVEADYNLTTRPFL